MKKKLLSSLFITLVYLLPISVKSQVNYSFAASSGAYTANGGTSIIPSNNVDVWSSSTTIGFTFTYNCNTYTTFQANSSGFMTLGTSYASYTTSNPEAVIGWSTNSLSAPPVTNVPIIAPLWGGDKSGNTGMGIDATGNVNYSLTGVAPNRVLTIEWFKMDWNWNATSPSVSFQVKLFETTNKIEFVYDLINAAKYSAPNIASIGLADKTAPNYLSLNNSGVSPTASSTVMTNTIATSPVSGQIYSWTPSCGSITTGAVNPTTINLAGCAGTATATVAFTSSGMVAGNVYTAQLSDSSGSFASPINIGTLTSSAASGTMTVTIPAGMIAGTNYQIQIVSSNPAVTGSASASFTINTSCVQSISLGTITPGSFTLGSCAATATATVTFSSLGVISFGAGNIDSLFMSDETGSFVNEVYVGSLSTTATSGTITFTVPAGSPTGSLYQLQLISSNPNIESNLSSAFTITSSCVKPTITTGTLSASTYNLANCAATATGTVAFTTAGTYSAGNVYTAQLSDGTGSFANPTNIGTLTSTASSGTITFTIPAATQAGTNYLIRIVSSKPVETGSSSVSFTITATCVVTLCPTLTSIILNACNSGCNEGDGEVTLLNTLSYSISIAAIKGNTKIIQYYGSSAVYSNGTGAPNAYTGTLTAQAATTSALNAGTGCSGAFVEGFTAGTIPAGSTVMMVPNTFGSCESNYNFSNVCTGYKPIYVLYYETGAGSTTGQWNTSGNYANYQSGSNPKYIAFNLGIAGCGAQYFTYDAGQENSGNVDGQAITFSGNPSTTATSPVNAATYPYTSGCTLPTVLPVSLLDFTANKTTNNISLKWATVVENNNNYFEVEYSLDAVNFIPYTQVKGAGSSESRKDYTCAFTENIGNNTPYFRLKQVDFNGNFVYSNVIMLDNSSLNKSDLVAYYNTDKDKIVTRFNLDLPQLVNVSLYNVAGAKIQETSPILYSGGDNEILLNTPDKAGIYLLVYQAGDGLAIYKKIVVVK